MVCQVSENGEEGSVYCSRLLGHHVEPKAGRGREWKGARAGARAEATAGRKQRVNAILPAGENDAQGAISIVKRQRAVVSKIARAIESLCLPSCGSVGLGPSDVM